MKKVVEAFATCATCIRGERKSLMAPGQLFCTFKEKRVSTNGVCTEYTPTTDIQRRVKKARGNIVAQRDLFNE